LQNNKEEYIIPDVLVSFKNNSLLVELNSEFMPKVRVNPNYSALIRRADSSRDNQFLKEQFIEAKWFLKSLQNRNETLLKVATCIVEHQKAFFEQGEEAMQPLVLQEVAVKVGLHESTISRITTQKYMYTPKGIFELKFFFSSYVTTTNGGKCSSTAIQALIRKLVEHENVMKPYSDDKIAHFLSERGITVARRTVAKYREMLAIPPSNERKVLF